MKALDLTLRSDSQTCVAELRNELLRQWSHGTASAAPAASLDLLQKEFEVAVG